MKKIILLAAIALLTKISLFSEETPVPALHKYTLENGLELYVSENHSVPLVYIEIAVKCGAYTQEPKTAGLFHLYEHMMFKGNSLYPDAAGVTRALSNMGCSSWNGSTGLECVNYYFTIPSSELENGLRFWSAAIRTPLLDKKELENEKKVVLSEIKGKYSDPGRILTAAKAQCMFSDAPWKLDPGGSDKVVMNATVKGLKAIQKKFYIPNNSAVFVGGDISPDKVYELVKKIYGDWEKSENPFKEGLFQHDKEPFSTPKKLVMPFEKISTQLCQIQLSYRGPDAYFDREDTYACDILTYLLRNPDGTFSTTLRSETFLGIPDSNYLWGSYLTTKQASMLDFGCMVTYPEEEITERSGYFAEKLIEALDKAVQVSDEQIQKVVSRIEDTNLYAYETSEGLLSECRNWWITCDDEYFYTYQENLRKVDKSKLTGLVNKYIRGKNPLMIVIINPEIYEKTKEQFKADGFEEISADNAFWFNK